MTNPMTTQGDLITGGASGAPDRLAAGPRGTSFLAGGSGVAPRWGWDLDSYANRQGCLLNRPGPASAFLALGGGVATGSSGGAFAVGSRNSLGDTRRATVTADSYPASFYATSVMDAQMTRHRFVGQFAFSGVMAQSGRRFFAGAVRDPAAPEVFASDTPTAPTVGFFLRGTANDTTMQILVANDSDQQVVDTGIAVSEATPYLGIYEIRQSDLTISWALLSLPAAGTPALLGAGSFAVTSSPFSLAGTDIGLLVGADAGSAGTYYAEAGDFYCLQGELP